MVAYLLKAGIHVSDSTRIWCACGQDVAVLAVIDLRIKGCPLMLVYCISPLLPRVIAVSVMSSFPTSLSSAMRTSTCMKHGDRRR